MALALIGIAVEAPFTGDAEIIQFHTPGLGDNSYLLLSAGEAAIIDPQRDVDRVRLSVAESGARAVAVVETHVHNDYVSGGPALAREFGAEYVVPAEAGYEMRHRPVRDGDEIRVGHVLLRAMHTPGHTPHHTSYAAVEDGVVRAVFTGGCVLVGACGRTDLAGSELTEGLTRAQYRSAQRIAREPGATVIGPTHGAGSFCAASAASAETWTTVERELTRNPAYLAAGEDDFMRTQLSRLMDHPAYYEHMAPRNRIGMGAWEPRLPARLSPDDVATLEPRVVLIDGRGRREAAAGRIAGSVNVELDPQFGTYLAWLYPYGTRFAVVLGRGQDPVEPVRQLARIGLDTVTGVLEFEDWAAEERPVVTMEVTDVAGMRRAIESGRGRALDVRQDLEWRDGHVPGALHVHVADLPKHAADLRDAGTLYVYCRSGHRASMGATLVHAAGGRAVVVDGGFEEWVEQGHPTES